MKPIIKGLLALNLVVLLVYTMFYVREKEQILEEGQLVLLDLGPVDPRSLMQGDYMRLDYAVTQGINRDSLPKTGYLVVTLDENGVGQRQRFQAEMTPLEEGEFLLNYTHPRPWTVNIGAESYFFQEGTAETYEAAEYGGLRIDDEGNSLLVGLYDDERQLLQ